VGRQTASIIGEFARNSGVKKQAARLPNARIRGEFSDVSSPHSDGHPSQVNRSEAAGFGV
jgi:hypothetical protein